MLKKNGFVVALLAVILLAYLHPQLGSNDGPLKAGLISKWGVMVVFLLQGLSLKTTELAGGMRHFKIHGFIQIWIFILSAIILALLGFVLKFFGLNQLANGFFYLALVPTTISSAVAFTATAGGNVPLAIFNTTLSNTIGVFWVPMGCLVLFAAGGSLQPGLIGPLLWKVTQLILIPMVVGQLIRPLIRNQNWFGQITPSFKYINQGIILFIVYAAFCRSISSDVWGGMGAAKVIVLVLFTVSAMLIIHASVWVSAGWVTKNHANRIAILFCSSQKTLAAGAPLAVAIFSHTEQMAQFDIGLLLLPLISYHPVQLILAAYLMPQLSLPR